MAAISHKALFEKLRDDTVISKSTQYAHWTLPQLMADYQEVRTTGRVTLERDYQEIGAILINHLATKLVRIMFPTTHPFFRVDMSKELRSIAANKGASEEEVNASLAQTEMEAIRVLFLNASYAQLILALKHLIVTGNALVYRDVVTHKCTTYGLQSFSVRRDGRGNLLDCVLRESTYVEALSEDVQTTLRSVDRARYSRPEQVVEVYTRIHRELRDKNVIYVVSQEIDTTPVGEPSTYPEHLCPWFVPTWSLLAGEHYGRGMVEDFAGGFAKLSDISEAHALYAVEMMRVINLVSAGSGTDIDDIANAETGEYVRGDPASVHAHEAGDAAKLQQATAEIEATFARLSRAFMYQSNVRNAERVTAYELQRDAQEAENALGGAVSTLSAGLQVPLAHVLLYETRESALAGLISGDFKPDITAGIPALGRSSDVQNLLMASQEAAAILPLTQLDSRISPQKVIDMIFAGRSVDTSKVYFSPEEMQQMQEAQQQMQQGQQQLLQASTVADQADQLAQLQGQA